MIGHHGSALTSIAKCFPTFRTIGYNTGMPRKKVVKEVDLLAGYLGKKSRRKVNENDLLGLGGVAIDAYNLIQELETKLNKLEAELEKSKPVCPFCKTAMYPVNFTHYYHIEGTRCWFCNCDDFPGNVEVQRHHEGY